MSSHAATSSSRPSPSPSTWWGCPSFPIGFESDSAGVPRPIETLFGAPPYEEDRLLELAAAYQRITDWHRRKPADPDALRDATPDDAGDRPRIDLFEVVETGE